MITVAGFPATVVTPDLVTRPPVVLLHGAFADHTCFDTWLPRIAARGHVAIAASRRGRLGVGPDRAAGVTFDDYLADTLAVLDALDGAPVVVGHSLGGLLAQKVAELGRARALVLLASAPPAMLTAQAAALPSFAPLLPRILTGRPVIVSDRACSVLALNKVAEQDRPALLAGLVHESGKVYRAAMTGAVRTRRASVPVLVIGGTEDRIISTRITRSVARHHGVEPVLLEGHGHWLMTEPGWESLLDDVLRWVDEVAPSLSDA